MKESSEIGLKTIIYIDGFNFYYGAVKNTPYKWLDIEALCRHLLPHNQIVKIRYFTARVQNRSNDPKKSVRQQIYLRALATLPLVEMHYGHFTTKLARMPLADSPKDNIRWAEVLRTEEKGSDVNLATYLLFDACKKRCELAVVISNDSDLAEAIRVAQSGLGVPVGLINPHPPDRRSRKLHELPCLFFKQIRGQALANTQLPDIIYDGQGEVRKPTGW